MRDHGFILALEKLLQSQSIVVFLLASPYILSAPRLKAKGNRDGCRSRMPTGLPLRETSGRGTWLLSVIYGIRPRHTWPNVRPLLAVFD